ncbi:hypothetical protein [Burkholderia pseudomallei]|uniref:hypothetical protein n=1 Tax=Burkholderia pseudomallei TaxID=28450 RepID=UPI00053778CA|nr:hypothetical protein [Burkholderia pseudomallei]KGX64869.1 hypothetical protein Y025_1901 [Burkholderia pseudomallei TSV32]
MNNFQTVEAGSGPDMTASSMTTLAAARRHAYVLLSLGLALLTMLTSLGIAAMSGWQRGGALPEQLGNGALAVAAVLGAHLMPALCRAKPLAVRCGAACMWIVSLVVVFYGQMTFFLLAQQHAGDQRAQSMSSTSALALPMRSLTVIGQDQKKVRTLLSANDTRHCDRDCKTQRMRHEILTAKLDALSTEADEVKRQQARDDRRNALADSLHGDPVTARLSVLTGLDEQKLNLLLALVCAGVLDCMGSLCWWLVFDGSRAAVTMVTTGIVLPDNASRPSLVNSAPEPTADGAMTVADEIDGRLVQLMRDVAAGKLNPTVDGIRKHLRCAQKKANELHREYHALRLALQAEASPQG